MNEEQIIDGIVQCDETALAELMRLYGEYAFSVALRIAQQKQTAEECVNDALAALWTSIPPRPKSLKFYFAALVRNCTINRMQKENAAKRGGGRVQAVYEELSECISSGQMPEKTVLHKELSLAVDRFLQTLPERDRSVFLRRYYFFEDTQSIARRYFMRTGNVLLVLSRTRKKLRNFLQTEGFLE